MTYSSTGTSGNGVVSIVSNTFQITNGSTAGRQYITGPLTTYSSPFNATLNSNTDTITWAFNAQMTNTAVPNGFANGSFAMAVVLAGTNGNLNNNNSTNTGYAVVYGGSGFRNFRLVRYINGLGSSGVITNIINTGTDDLTSSADVVSVQVKYHPPTRTWSLFSRDNNTAWTNPLSGNLTQRGSPTVDSTYTGAANSIFGFFYNYGITNQPGIIAKFDDFSVRVRSATANLKAFPTSTINFGYQWINTASVSRSFDLYGSGFTGNITATAPAHFQVCTDTSNPANWTSSLNLLVSADILAPLTIYVRFLPTSAGYKSGAISFSGGGGTGYPSINLIGYCNTTNTWINNLGGQWTVASNWSQNSVPQPGDSIRITTAGTYSIDSLPTAGFPNITIGPSTIVTFSSLGRASTISLTGTDSALIIRNGGTLILSPSGSGNLMEIKFVTGSNGKATIAGTLQCGSNGLTTNNLGSYNASNSITTVSGTLITENSGQITSLASNLIFTNGSNFRLNAGLTIPTATWQTGSTCNILTRSSSGNLTGVDQAFHHVIVELLNITSGQGINCNGALKTINGKLYIKNTNWTSNDKRAFILSTNTDYKLTIKDSLIIDNNAELELGTNSKDTLNLEGHLVIKGTGHFYKKCGSSCGVNISIINFASPSSINPQNFSFVSNLSPEPPFNQGTTASVYVINIGDSTSTSNTVKLLTNLTTCLNTTTNVSRNATLDCGTFTVKDTGQFIGGTFNLKSAGTLKMGSPQGITNSPAASGNIQTLTRTFNTGANYHYAGATTQVSGDGLPSTINDLIIENSGGSTGVTLARTTTVAGNLRLRTGLLTLAASDTVIVNSGIPEYSATSFVNGKLGRIVPTGSSARPFPVGNLNAYALVSTTIQNVTTQGRLTVHTTATDHPNINGSNFTSSKTINRYWTMANAGIIFGSYNATFNYVNGDKDAGVNSANIYAGRFSNSVWTYPTMGTINATSAAVSGVFAFGDYQLGECGIPSAPDSAVASRNQICSGDTVRLSVFRGGISSFENVEWFIDSCNGASIGTGNNLLVSPGSTTTFYGKFSGTASCSYSSECRSVTVTVNPAPLLAITNPDPVCSAVSPTINLTNPSVTSGSSLFGGSLQYYTNPSGTNLLNNPSAVSSSGTYYIKAVTAAGCSDIEAVTATINNSPVLTINGNAVSCSPALANLTLSSLTAGSTLQGGALTYWNDAAATSSVSTPGAVNSGTYYIKATTAEGCTDIEPVVAQVFNSPNLIINNPGPLCAPAPASFNLTQSSLTSGSFLTGATLLYYSDRNYSNAVSNPSSVGSGRYYIKAEISGTTCNDNDSVDIIVREFGQWLGVNNNWNDAQNWCGGVPDASRDVTIPSGLTNYPVLSTGQAGATRNISLAPGSSLTVNGNTMKVYGSISGNRNINLSSGTLEMAGNIQQNLGGIAFTQARIRNLVISNPAGVILSSATADSLKISGKLSFGNVNNSQFQTGNNLTLVSDSNGTAAVADITNNGVNSGNSITGHVTVERYITQARKWQFLSIPTNTSQTFQQAWMEGAASITQNPKPGYGTIITDNRADWLTRGFDTLSPGGPSVKLYNPLTGNYDAINSANSPINSSYGYMAYIRGDRSARPSNSLRSNTTLRTTGPLKQGNQASISIPDSAFVAVGNPFASSIDMGKIFKPNCLNAIYIWDPALSGSYGVGGYQTFFGFQDTGSYYNYYPTPGGGSYPSGLIPYNQIQSGQAFFVRGGINASVQLKETDKMPDSTRQVMRPGPPPFSIIRTSLHSAAGNNRVLEDGAAILFAENFQNGIGHEDAEKMRNAGMNVTISKSSKLFAVEGRRYLEEKDTFILNVTGLRQNLYEWEIDMRNMRSQGRIAFLIDKFTLSRTRLNLEGTSYYRFSPTADSASLAADRFMIVFSEPKRIPLEFTRFSAIRKEQRIDLFWEVRNETGFWKYTIERTHGTDQWELLAQNSQTASGTGISAYSFSDNQPLPAENIYRIKATDAFGTVVYSDKISLPASIEPDFFGIYPNPATGRSIKLLIPDTAPGNYLMELSDNSGNKLLSRQFSLQAEQREVTIPLGNGISPGSYFISLTEPNGNKKAVQKLVIL